MAARYGMISGSNGVGISTRSVFSRQVLGDARRRQVTITTRGVGVGKDTAPRYGTIHAIPSRHVWRESTVRHVVDFVLSGICLSCTLSGVVSAVGIGGVMTEQLVSEVHLSKTGLRVARRSNQLVCPRHHHGGAC